MSSSSSSLVPDLGPAGARGFIGPSAEDPVLWPALIEQRLGLLDPVAGTVPDRAARLDSTPRLVPVDVLLMDLPISKPTTTTTGIRILARWAGRRHA